jgi:hypothetical protein
MGWLFHRSKLQARVVRDAVRVAGSVDALAQKLGVPAATVEAYLAGGTLIPDQVMDALKAMNQPQKGKNGRKR